MPYAIQFVGRIVATTAIMYGTSKFLDKVFSEKKEEKKNEN